ncbi:MAG TPA: Rieske 2Fe-2S domain-containing protein [Candidatus Nitrosotalea sp.]|nr:Rieske 2Fe-2S domain-containing protein [Candidatus Nitrosotalea sp.]
MDEGTDVRGIPTTSVPVGTVTGAGEYALCNINGEYFAVSRWCRHRGGDLAKGAIDGAGCLVCPVHGARYDVRTGETVDGPRVPGGRLFKAVMNRRPLARGNVEVRDGSVFVS